MAEERERNGRDPGLCTSIVAEGPDGIYIYTHVRAHTHVHT